VKVECVSEKNQNLHTLFFISIDVKNEKYKKL